MRSLPTTALLALSAGAISTGALAAPRPYPLPPRYDHVVIVVLENVNPDQVIGAPAAPYITSLADQGVSFDCLYAFKHTSAPNYGELFAGHENGIIDGAVAPGVPFTTPNLGAELRHAGLSFTGYAQSLPAPGSTVVSSGSYVRGHNPWVNWQNDAPDRHPNQLPSSINLPFNGYFPTDFSKLPTVAMVVPDNAHNMHDGTTPQRITVGDNWLRDNLGPFANWAKSNNSLLIVTTDEDAFNLNNNLNKIPTVFYGAGVKGGVALPQSFTLHNLLRTVEDMYNLPHAQAANYVRPIVGPFIGDPELLHANFTSAQDTQLRQDQPSAAFAAASLLRVSLDDNVAVGNQPVQALVRFDNVAAQLPADATILSAKLTLWTSAAGNTATPVKVHRMLTNWNESSTWNSLSAGVSPNGVEARAAEDFLFAPAVNAHPFFFDVSDSVQAWLDGEPNHGWAILPTGDDPWDFISSENSNASQRPSLELTYALLPTWAPSALGSWEDESNWKYGLPNAPAAIARFTAAAPSTVQLGDDKTVGTLLFDTPATHSIQDGSGGRLILANRQNTASIQVKQGRHAIQANVVLLDSTVIDAAASSALELSGGVTVASAKTLAKSGPGQLIVTGGIQMAIGAAVDVTTGNLDVDRITGDGELTVRAAATAKLTGDASRPSRITRLTIAGQSGRWDARLDLGRAQLVIDYTGKSPLPTILDQLAQSRDAGWQGNGIGSSAATDMAGVGYRELGAGGDFDSDGTALLLRLTLLGDANLDGAISFPDLVAVAQHFDTTDGSAFWSDGDFNYDHNVDFSDLILLSQNYNGSLPAALPGAAPEFQAALASAFAHVPEPTTLVPLLLGALCATFRRHTNVIR
jgi:acid phosphatase